ALGVFAGTGRKEPRVAKGTLWLYAAGVAARLAGLAWGRMFPINKNLWTSSFALLSAGLAAQALAVCHWLVDAMRVRVLSRPLAAFGRNPLAAYFLSVGFDAVLTRWRIAGGGSLKAVFYRVAFPAWVGPGRTCQARAPPA